MHSYAEIDGLRALAVVPVVLIARQPDLGTAILVLSAGLCVIFFAALRQVPQEQIEAARIAMTRKIKRGGKVWINVFPDKPFTKKPAETRMGSGKGSPEWWIANVKPGRVMFELSGVAEPVAKEALRRAIHKLPMKCRIVQREAGEI